MIPPSFVPEGDPALRTGSKGRTNGPGIIKRGTSYFGNRDLRHFRRDLDDMQAFPFHYLLHTFSENDLLYYRATLRDMVWAAKDKGLEVYIDPWGVGKVFGGEAFSQFIAENPDECQILTNGQRVPAACLTSQKFQDFMSRWIEGAIFLGPDVIFWDEPHYYLDLALASKSPNTYHLWSCFCGRCRRLFKEEAGFAMPAVLTDEVIQFRKSILMNFLKDICRQVREQGVKNAVCLLPVPDKKIENFLGGDIWKEISRLQDVDILSTDPYGILFNIPVESFVRDYGQKVSRLSERHQKESEIWIQAFRIPKGAEMEVVKSIETAADCQPHRIAVWSYQGTSCMSELSCEEPEIVWEKIRDAFAKLNSN